MSQRDFRDHFAQQFGERFARKARGLQQLGREGVFCFRSGGRLSIAGAARISASTGEVVEMEGPQFNCSQLGCIIELRDRELVLVNPTTRARWVTEAEQMGQTLGIERAARLAAEAEIARLRAELEK